jgi:hypothetical protein
MSSNHTSGKHLVIKKDLLPDPYHLIQEESLKLFNEKRNEYSDALNNYGFFVVLKKLEESIKETNKTDMDPVSNNILRSLLFELQNHCSMAILHLDEGKSVHLNEEAEEEFDRCTIN